MKSRQYWVKRFEFIENMSNQMGIDAYSRIEPAFIQAEKNIQNEINVWYARFAANNNVSLADARRMLDAKELKELKWDVNQFIKYGKQNSFDGKWMKELENASAKFHISKLEAIKLRTQQAMEVAFGNELDEVDRMARNILTEDYYRSIFEVQKGFNLGYQVGQIDQRKLDLLVNKPWATDGKNFSSRIWNRKTQMVNDLHQELTRTLIQGKPPDEAIKHMERFVDRKIKNAKNAAGRLVMTEQAYFHSVSQKEAFNELDIEEFEIVATLDSHTSEICQEMDGKHFPMKDYQPGVTAPPFHVYCRSVTAPYFNDEWSNTGERAARNEEGQTYYVPSNITYPKWKEIYIDGTGQLDVPKAKPQATWKNASNPDKFKTKKEAFAHFKNQGIKISDSRKYPMDENVAIGIAEWHNKFINYYSSFNENIKYKLPELKIVAPSGLPYGVLGQFSYYTTGQVSGIKLNSGLHYEYDYIKKSSAASAKSGWHSGKNPFHTFIHEYGHYVSHSLEMAEDNFQHNLIKECVEKYKEIHPEYQYSNQIGLDKALSKYGTTSESECFAEAFAEYFGEEEPREFATIFGELLEKYLKGENKK